MSVSPAPNPPLPQRCGLKVAIVVDALDFTSASDLTQFQTVMAQVVNALAGTPSSISVVTSAPTVRTLLALTHVLESSGLETIRSALNSISTGGVINWEALLREASKEPVDLVLLCTNGNPTATSPGADALTQGIIAANQLKTRGTRIITIGLGSAPTIDNLRAISGNDERSVYDLRNVDILSTELREMSLRLCGRSIRVVKKVKRPNGTYAPAAGWQFIGQTNGTAPPSITPPSGITSADGTVNFNWQAAQNINITITEMAQNGYVLTDVIVKAGGQTPAFSRTDNTLTLNVNLDEPISCECEFLSDRLLTLKPDRLPEASAQQSYATQLTTEGSSTTVTFSLVQNEATVAGANRGLPPGITLSPNGLLSGIPTAAGSFLFLVQAQDAEGYIVTRSYTLNVMGSVTTTTSPGNLIAPAGLEFTYTLEATGNPAPTFRLEPGAPSGMKLDSITGRMTWTPSALGSYPVTVRLSNGVAPDTLVSLTIVTTLGMLYSIDRHRSDPDLLQGAKVSGDIYVFMEPSQDIKSVQFILKQVSPEKRIATQTENIPPFDFRGTEGTQAKPFNTSEEDNGFYIMTATVTLKNEPNKNQASREVVAQFTIENNK